MAPHGGKREKAKRSQSEAAEIAALEHRIAEVSVTAGRIDPKHKWRTCVN